MKRKLNQFYRDHNGAIIAFELGAIAAFGFVIYANNRRQMLEIKSADHITNEEGVEYILVELMNGTSRIFHKTPDQ
jgi:hypothetical protein